MTNQKRLHTPEGVRDIFGDECARKLALEHEIRREMRTFGYRDIETPSFEYFDVFGQEIGTIPSAELYKFFDREGNTLVLRPDFTPSIARTAARYFAGQRHPVRLCYQGNTFINSASLRGTLHENTQMGAELMGDESAAADAEVIAMAIRTLLCTGLKEFQISIGHVGYFNALSREAGLDQETEEGLRTLIRNRNLFGAEKLVQSKPISEPLKAAFAALPSLFGGADVLKKAAVYTEDAAARSALARLQEVYDLLLVYGLSEYVSFDLGMMGSYMYYTGVIFRGYTYGTGDALVKGGRYDNLLDAFGPHVPSIGFAVVVAQLMNALSRQHIPSPPQAKRALIAVRRERQREGIVRVQTLRQQGQIAELYVVPPHVPLREADIAALYQAQQEIEIEIIGE